MSSKPQRRRASLSGRNLNFLCMDFSLQPYRPEDLEVNSSSTSATAARRPSVPPKSFSDTTQTLSKTTQKRAFSEGDTGRYFSSARRLSFNTQPIQELDSARSSCVVNLDSAPPVKPQYDEIIQIPEQATNPQVGSVVDASSPVELDSSDKQIVPARQPDALNTKPPRQSSIPLGEESIKITQTDNTNAEVNTSHSLPNHPERRSAEGVNEKRPEIEPAPILNTEIFSSSRANSNANSNETTEADEKEAGIHDEEAAQPTPKLRFYQRWRQQIKEIYAPDSPPELILPTGPTDEEKYCYLRTNRLGLYSFGVLSFLSLSVGMWLFVICAPPFYWFGVMVVLLQAYLVVSYTVSLVDKDYNFEAHKKALADFPILPETCPTVDVYLPCCKEPIEVLENTYKHVRALLYPEGKLKVYVLDDGASDEVKALALSYGYNYICREDRPRLKKAGNLRWAFARTEGDFFNIYDADFCPRPDFLLEVIPQHLAYPDTAIFQTPQFFRTSTQQTWVEQGASSVQELFYRVIEVNRNRWGASICVGSNAVYRREALKDVGGTAEIGFSEDVHTGFYAMTRGWKVRYLPLCLACGICPDTPRAFFSQQMRWCMGSTTLLTNPEFWKSSLNPIQKVCFLSGMMYYSAISLSIFLNPMPGLFLIWVRPDFVRYYNLAFAIPSIFYSLIAIRMWARASYGLNVQFIMVIQSYAYLTAIKDRLFGRALAWVPSGDTKAHKNNKYRNMRRLCWFWNSLVMTLLISGVTYRVLGGLAWYDTIPVLVLDSFNVFLSHRFLFCSGAL